MRSLSDSYCSTCADKQVADQLEKQDAAWPDAECQQTEELYHGADECGHDMVRMAIYTVPVSAVY